MEFSPALSGVAQVVARVADEELMSRFGRLREREVWEKAPGDLVTAADVAAERRLTAELESLLPRTVQLGEEGEAADPGLWSLLDGDRPVRILDPVDGTANYERGDPRFSVLVALALRGELVVSWLCAPALRLTASARAGGGAEVNGRAISGPRKRPERLRVVVTDPVFRTEADRAWIARLEREPVEVGAAGAAGTAYLDLALGRQDAVVFGWTTIWDHAAGVLLHKESGGWVATGDGSPFRASTGNVSPLILAPDAESGAWLGGVVSG